MVVVGATILFAGAHRLVASALKVVTSKLRLGACAPTLIAGTPVCSRVHRMFSPALRWVLTLITITPMLRLYQSSEISVTPKANRNELSWSDTLLTMMQPCLHSTSSQTLLEDSRD
jgi:hypothetical protein